MSLIPVRDALRLLLERARRLPAETVPLAGAAGRVLAAPVAARRTQPPFDASAMDGFAVRARDLHDVPAELDVVGVSQAGRGFDGKVGVGEAVRIFTGAPVPEGADSILVQEDARSLGRDRILALEPVAPMRHIRPAGLDFNEGEILLDAGRRLDPAALSLAAAANHETLDVVCPPRVAIIATGDELLAPGSMPGPHQIIASNSFGVAAIASGAGAEVIDLGIAPDEREAIATAVRSALSKDVHVIITLGGASVGERDLVGSVLADLGMTLAFWKIAMRPGKPLMVGHLGAVHVLGLPGNPVSSLVCSHLFLIPLLARLGGRAYRPDIRPARLAGSMPPNDEREDYVRAAVRDASGILEAAPFGRQDSSMLKILAAANGLVIRPPNAPAAAIGDMCRVLMLREPD